MRASPLACRSKEVGTKLRNRGRKRNVLKLRSKEKANDVVENNTVHTVQFSLPRRKWHPWAIENLWSGRGLLVKLQLQVSLSNNDSQTE